MKLGSAPSRNEPLALEFRIGVTGHRSLPHEPATEHAVNLWLEQISTWLPPTRFTPIRIVVVSSLAEGSDRLVATCVLEQLRRYRPRLEVILPRPPEKYVEDFSGESSIDGFYTLLKQASRVTVVDEDADPLEGYARAGTAVVDSSDLLFAIWDSKPARGAGGTAHVVEYARLLEVPVVVLDSNSPGLPPSRAPAPAPVRKLKDDMARLEALNGMPEDVVADLVSRERGWLDLDGSVPLPAWADEVATWALPALVRADSLAVRCQRSYLLIGTTLFASAALAVAAEAAQLVFYPRHLRWSFVEVGLMLLILAGFLAGRRLSFHDRWVEYRSLAEALRGSMFVAMTGVSDEDLPPRQIADARRTWYECAFAETWSRRPAVLHPMDEVPRVTRILSEAWLGSQSAYHRLVSEAKQRRYEVMTRTVVALFAATLLIAVCHATVDEDLPLVIQHLLTFAAIALPGFGAALTGIRDQRQYRMHAERSLRVVDRLEVCKAALESETDLDEIRRIALEAQSMLTDEAGEWSDALQLQNLEIAL